MKNCTYMRTNLGIIKDFISLTKPRLMSLSVFTAFAGFLLAPGRVDWTYGVLDIVAIAFGAGCAGVLNMWYEHDIDSLMERTKNRPIAAGRISPAAALIFGVGLGVGSLLLLGIFANMLSVFLMALTIFIYFVVYTVWLKPRTWYSLIIGGSCGALPPVIGWACVYDSISLEALLMCFIIFLWQVPHFLALAFLQKESYAQALVPVLPLAEGDRVAKLYMVLFTVLMNLSVFAPIWCGMFGVLYAAGCLVLTVLFNFYVWGVYAHKDLSYARKLFIYSIYYLLVLFVLIIVDHLFLKWGVVL